MHNENNDPNKRLGDQPMEGHQRLLLDEQSNGTPSAVPVQRPRTSPWKTSDQKPRNTAPLNPFHQHAPTSTNTTTTLRMAPAMAPSDHTQIGTSNEALHPPEQYSLHKGIESSQYQHQPGAFSAPTNAAERAWRRRLIENRRLREQQQQQQQQNSANSAQSTQQDQSNIPPELRVQVQQSFRRAMSQTSTSIRRIFGATTTPDNDHTSADCEAQSTNRRYDEKDEQKRSKCILYLLFVLIIALIVALVILFGGKNKPEKMPMSDDGPSDVTTDVPKIQKTIQEQALHDFFRPVISDEEALEDPNSPQYRAIAWLANEDTTTGDSNEIGIDVDLLDRLKTRFVLATFYFATSEKPWTDQLHFLSEKHECEWNKAYDAAPRDPIDFEEEIEDIPIERGVFCDDYDRVTRLRIDDNNLYGSLPVELGLLTTLQELQLSHSPCIWLGHSCEPPIGRSEPISSKSSKSAISSLYLDLTNLKTLDLSWNSLSSSLFNMVKFENLRRLNLRGNNFESISSLPLQMDSNDVNALEFLDVEGNKLNGIADVELQVLSNLKVLELSKNPDLKISENFSFPSTLKSLRMEEVSRFYSTLPTSIGRLTDLESLALGKNYISGQLPNEIALLTSLKRVSLKSNSLTGSIPLTGIDNSTSFGEQLLIARLNENKFSGSIPIDIGEKYHNLTWLDFARNELEGTIPNSMGDMTSLSFLDLSTNWINGTLSSWIGNLTSLIALDVAKNDMTGILPMQLSRLTSLKRLDVSNNLFYGDLNFFCNNEDDVSHWEEIEVRVGKIYGFGGVNCNCCIRNRF